MTDSDSFPTRLTSGRTMFRRTEAVVHARNSNANPSPWPRANLLFVYNSVANALESPYAADSR